MSPLTDPEALIRYVLALAVVLALALLCGWVVRRLGGAALLAAPPTRHRRLKVVESLPLDPRHRLVLVRRDATEHLVLLGPTGALVVERGIPGGETAPSPTSVSAASPEGGSAP